ncbi:MAG: hypothetical protein AAB912_00040, partial [Patescibacteria group bacterium]
METPTDLALAEKELAALKKRMRKGAHMFWSVIPGLLALALLVFGLIDGKVGVWVLFGICAVWSLGTLVGFIPPGPWPHKYDTENL